MAERWTPGQARAWYERRAWPCGFNYLPSTAVNSTEFWQAETFDLPTIQRELAWGAELGFNTARVFLPFVVWRHDAAGLKTRIAEFLSAADEQKITTSFCLFDDCAFSKKDPWLGKQNEPVPGKMATSWTASPGHTLVNDRASWPELERYVRDIVGAFARDERVLMWDLYNEPGNEGQGDKSLALVKHTFDWARTAGPSQPLTSGLWNYSPDFGALNQALLDASDVLSFHSYTPLEGVRDIVARLKTHGRPVICTEYMARLCNSRFSTHLPYFKSEGVGAIHWGLVNGRMQTNFPWPSLKPTNDEWFHDIFHADGRPYKPDEFEVIRACTGAGSGCV
jgi:hypothetical protein